MQKRFKDTLGKLDIFYAVVIGLGYATIIAVSYDDAVRIATDKFPNYEISVIHYYEWKQVAHLDYIGRYSYDYID